ncbi:hypothetical protein [Chordicoccus furentiruminis]|uniref:hypothetical protein n=1 Tax=Chordicoccus furentiruminis TaxID=2709410 RepID=UPI0023A80A78|nr:hypothetical protein [Chordicoccus furentiruminis]
MTILLNIGCFETIRAIHCKNVLSSRGVLSVSIWNLSNFYYIHHTTVYYQKYPAVEFNKSVTTFNKELISPFYFVILGPVSSREGFGRRLAEDETGHCRLIGEPLL